MVEIAVGVLVVVSRGINCVGVGAILGVTVGASVLEGVGVEDCIKDPTCAT